MQPATKRLEAVAGRGPTRTDACSGGRYGKAAEGRHVGWQGGGVVTKAGSGASGERARDDDDDARRDDDDDDDARRNDDDARRNDDDDPRRYDDGARRHDDSDSERGLGGGSDGHAHVGAPTGKSTATCSRVDVRDALTLSSVVRIDGARHGRTSTDNGTAFVVELLTENVAASHLASVPIPGQRKPN